MKNEIADDKNVIFFKFGKVDWMYLECLGHIFGLILGERVENKVKELSYHFLTHSRVNFLVPPKKAKKKRASKTKNKKTTRKIK